MEPSSMEEPNISPSASEIASYQLSTNSNDSVNCDGSVNEQDQQALPVGGVVGANDSSVTNTRDMVTTSSTENGYKENVATTSENNNNNNNNVTTNNNGESNITRELAIYKDVSAFKLRGLREESLNALERRHYVEEAVTYNVYVGGLGEEVDENDLFNYFSPCGLIDSCRVFRSKDEPYHKFAHPSLCSDVGYGFVHFITPEGQSKALSKEFNRPKIKNSCGYTKIAVEKTTLFVGGLPMSLKESDVSEMFRNSLINFRSIILKTGPPPSCTSRGSTLPSHLSRVPLLTNSEGFCFISFDTHKAAEAARQLLLSGPVHGKMLTVGWAEPQGEDEDEMDRVTTLFINNLASHVIDEQLKSLFAPVVRHLQTLESRGFAFVEYAEREACMLAMSKLNGTDFFGEKLTVTLARPLDYRNRAGPTRPFQPTSGAPSRGRGNRDKFFPHPYRYLLLVLIDLTVLKYSPTFYPYPPTFPPPPYRYHPYARPNPYDHPHGYDYSFYPTAHYDYSGYYDSSYANYANYGDHSKSTDRDRATDTNHTSTHSEATHQESTKDASTTPYTHATYNYYNDPHAYWQYQNYPAGYTTPATPTVSTYPYGNYTYPETATTTSTTPTVISTATYQHAASAAPVPSQIHDQPSQTAQTTPQTAVSKESTVADVAGSPTSQQVSSPSLSSQPQSARRVPPPPPPRRAFNLPPPPHKEPAQN